MSEKSRNENDLPIEFKRWGRVQSDHLWRPGLVYIDWDHRRTPPMRPVWTGLRICGLRPRWIQHRRTQHGWHVIISLTRRLPAAETVALQAILGSDRRRENLNLMRVLALPKHSRFFQQRWNLLFLEKAKSTRHAKKRSCETQSSTSERARGKARKRQR